MKVLNLYAGIGGNRKLWEDVEVTAVEMNPKIAEIYQEFFPRDKVVVGDAHQYLLDHYKEFDFIWSSPPCPTHSNVNNFLNAQGVIRYPDMELWQEIVFLKHFYKGRYCVENVISYYKPLYPCIERDRHYFWTNFFISDFESGRKKEMKISITNSRASTRRSAEDTINTLQTFLDIDLSKYNITDKRKCLANCVNPYLGLHILNESKRNIHPELF